MAALYTSLFDGIVARKCPIILHMDLNRTILQIDPAGGKSLLDVLNNNVAAITYGKPSIDKKSFTAEKMFPSSPPPDTDTLCSYDHFVDEILYPEPSNLSQISSSEERREIWASLSGMRRKLKNTFTCAGQPGEAFQHAVTEQQQALTNSQDGSIRYIIPSFYALVNTLSVLEWEFTLIFRTFGKDLKEVVREWKRFVGGKLEFKPQGPILSRMASAPSPGHGVVYRDKEGLCMVWGPSIPPPPPPKSSMETDGLTYLSSLPPYASAQKVSYHDLYDALCNRAKDSGNVVGFCDYYPYWSENAEHKFAGKVYPVMCNEDGGENPFQIFFDDNIYFDEVASIVDFRNATTGEPLDESLEQVYACRVNPYCAVVNEDYFCRELSQCIHKQIKRKSL